METLSDSRVAICRGSSSIGYPAPPFDPPRVYPELAACGPVSVDANNQVYALVREALRRLDLDAGRFDTPRWNPLGSLIRPGDHVLLKPNWVNHRHHSDDSFEQIITHAAVLRPLIDYVQLALRGEGRISIADGPMLSASFDAILARSGLRALLDNYMRPSACPIEVVDLRQLFFESRDDVIVGRRELPGDPRGSVRLDLGPASAFYGHRAEGRYYGADYDTAEVNDHHRGGVQEYLLSRTAVQADVIIDVPKLKTHKKVGTTLALKGVVGVNTERNWLPHHTQGTPAQGGDQFPTSNWLRRTEFAVVRTLERASLRLPTAGPWLFRFAKNVARPVFGSTQHTARGGGWHGNDTLWRTVLDINRALMYGTADGQLHPQPSKRRFVLVDGIVGGQGMGPVFADPVRCGVIIAGANAVATDAVATEVMGFDFRRVPYIDEAFRLTQYPLARFAPDAIHVVSNVEAWTGPLDALRAAAPFAFEAPTGWRGRIERSQSEQKRAV